MDKTTRVKHSQTSQLTLTGAGVDKGKKNKTQKLKRNKKSKTLYQMLRNMASKESCRTTTRAWVTCLLLWQLSIR